ncbi:unnamed protein product [Malus baccata var. baccata]
MQWKSWKATPDEVALEEGCPKEFKDREENWVCLCNHFQERSYVKKVKANKINREKKTLLQHSEAVGSSRVRHPASFRDSDQVYGPPKDVGFQILTNILDQTLGRRPGTYRKRMGNVRREEPRASSSLQSKGEMTALTAEVAGLRTELALYKSQISLII